MITYALRRATDLQTYLSHGPPALRHVRHRLRGQKRTGRARATATGERVETRNSANFKRDFQVFPAQKFEFDPAYGTSQGRQFFWRQNSLSRQKTAGPEKRAACFRQAVFLPSPASPPTRRVPCLVLLPPPPQHFANPYVSRPTWRLDLARAGPPDFSFARKRPRSLPPPPAP